MWQRFEQRKNKHLHENSAENSEHQIKFENKSYFLFDSPCTVDRLCFAFIFENNDQKRFNRCCVSKIVFVRNQQCCQFIEYVVQNKCSVLSRNFITN